MSKALINASSVANTIAKTVASWLPSHLEVETAICPIHGEYECYVDKHTGERSSCPACLLEKKQRYEDKRLSEHRIKIAGIPPRFVDKTLDNYIVKHAQQAHALELLNKFVGDFDPKRGASVILCGSTGVGKTHLAIGVLKALVRKGFYCVYKPLNDIFAEVKATYAQGSSARDSDVIDAYVQPQLLVIDEVGINSLTKSEDTILYKLINDRYNNYKSTIIVSNLTIKELTEVIGERIIDRLKEGGIALNMQLESYRK